MKIGTKNIVNVKYGDKQIIKAYSGNNLVWEKQPLVGSHHGYSWVDLGLPSGVLWADKNVGANNLYEYGNYYAWGEVTESSYYDSTTSQNYGVEVPNFSGQSRFDAAAAIWGHGWRMPTKEECEELDIYCSSKIVDYSEINPDIFIGGKIGVIKSTKNDKVIYLPLTGYKYQDALIEDNEKGHYWTSTPEFWTGDDLFYAYDLNIQNNVDNNSPQLYVTRSERYYGHAIRPVLDRSSLEL